MSASGSAPDSSIACLAEYMQQTREQYGTPMDVSREPAHWTNAMLSGTLPSDGRSTRPNGPCGASRRSIVSGEMTLRALGRRCTAA